jgi:DNA-binding CsgD family transcriptional regulator
MQWERPLDLLEAAYRLDGSDKDWTTGFVETLTKVLPKERIGCLAFILSGRVDQNGRTVIADFHAPSGTGVAGVVPDLQGALRRQLDFPPELLESLYFSQLTAETLSVATGLGEALENDASWQQVGWDIGVVRDSLGLVCHGDHLNSVVLSVALRKVTVLSDSERRVWQRIASHIGAALRLRSRRGVSPDAAAAVLSPTGKIEHLRQEVDGPSVREGFARRRQGRRRDVRPEAALEVWQGLHDGRWSLVDYIDTDRKAFVLAVRNEPARDVASALTDRQRAAVALASLGYPNKQIAYALGLTATAVAMLLARARAVVGVRTRAELVRAFKRSLAEAA